MPSASARRPGGARQPPTSSAYSAALRLIAARELSVFQIRERLERREYDAEAIDAAIERLRRVGAVDDRRVALSRARTAARLKRHGPARVRRQLAAIGIDRDTADDVVREVFAEHDEATLLDEALARRLRRARAPMTDPGERRRVLGHLIRLGFPLQAASQALRRARRSAASSNRPDDTDE